MSSADDQEELFPLLSLGKPLQKRILSKVDYSSFSRLEATCAEIKENSKNIRPTYFARGVEVNGGLDKWDLLVSSRKWAFSKALHAHLGEIPCKIHAKEVHLRDLTAETGEMPYILARIKGYKLTGDIVRVDDGSYEVEKLIQLIEAMKIKEIIIFKGIVALRELCVYPAFQNLSSVSLGEHNFQDSDFHRLKASEIQINCWTLTYSAVNSLLKEWKQGQREIQHIFLDRTTFRPYNLVNELIEGLEASLVWSTDSHEFSLLAHISPSKLRKIRRNGRKFGEDTYQYHYYVYTIRRFYDIHKPLLLFLNSNSVEIVANLDEHSALQDLLKDVPIRLKYHPRKRDDPTIF